MRKFIFYAIALWLFAAGCAHVPMAMLTVNSVPNPVLLGGPHYQQLHRNDYDHSKDINVEVKTSYLETWHDIGDTRYITERTRVEGANKAAFAVLNATQGNDSLDVYLSQMQVETIMIRLIVGYAKNSVSIMGCTAGKGRERKQ